MSSRRSSDCQASSFWGSSTIWASLSARLPQLLRHQLCDDYVIRSVLLNRPMTPKPRSRRRVSRRRRLRRLPRRPRRPSRLPVPNRGPGRSPRLVLAPVLAVAPSLVAALQHVLVRLHVRVSSNPPALHPSRSPPQRSRSPSRLRSRVRMFPSPTLRPRSRSLARHRSLRSRVPVRGRDRVDPLDCLRLLVPARVRAPVVVPELRVPEITRSPPVRAWGKVVIVLRADNVPVDPGPVRVSVCPVRVAARDRAAVPVCRARTRP